MFVRVVLFVCSFGCALTRERCCEHSHQVWLLTCLFWVGLRIVYARAVICGCRSAGQCVGVLCLSVCFVFLSLFFCWLVVIFLVCARACLVVSVCVRCACASVCVRARAFVCVACLCVCACGWLGGWIVFFCESALRVPPAETRLTVYRRLEI